MGLRSLRSRSSAAGKPGDSAGPTEKQGLATQQLLQRQSSPQVSKEFEAQMAGSNSRYLKRSSKTANSLLSHEKSFTSSTGAAAKIPQSNDNSVAVALQLQQVMKHQTRSKNGIRKETKVFLPEDEVNGNKIEQSSLDISASILATLDTRIYSRELLRDANAIFDKIIFPMSFPWAHNCCPAMRSIPHDIDELISGLCFDKEVTIEGWYGKFCEMTNESTKTLPEGAVAAVKRSTDPGILEYATSFPPTMAQRLSFPPLHISMSLNEDPSNEGELALRKYEEIQGRKRKRELSDSLNLKTKMVSIRVGSTSSRAIIFDRRSSCIKFLLAELPVEVQDGKRMTSLNSTSIAQSLGNYDCRHGFIKPMNGENRIDERVKSGRTRLIWTQPDLLVSQRAFKSLLSGHPMETGAHKRPRQVIVAIRIDGSLVTQSSFSDNLNDVNCLESIDAACKSSTDVRKEYRQCSLDTQRLLAEVLAGDDLCSAVDYSAQPFPFSISLNQDCVTAKLTVTPPKLECFTSQDGLLYTMCAKRGSFTCNVTEENLENGSTSSSNGRGFENCVTALADITAMKKNICSVCWSNNGIDGSSVVACESCSLRVHRSCYGRVFQEKKWKCDACRMFSLTHPKASVVSAKCRQYRWCLMCSMCHENGGSLFQHDASGSWIHDTCRIWSSSEVNPPPRCALCNKATRPVIRCAAKNCEVMFHPMCAIIASNAASLRRSNLNDEATFSNAFDEDYNEDHFLTTQYRLSRLEVGSVAFNETRVLAIGFCGFHNPSRRPDLQGLYPCGQYLEAAMRIPPFYDGEQITKAFK